jgi:hypothetical protein
MTTDTRCARTDLLVDQCGCAQHRGGRTVEEQTAVERAVLLARPGWFPAQYPGYCARCNTPFEPGAAITRPEPGELGWTAECCA